MDNPVDNSEKLCCAFHNVRLSPHFVAFVSVCVCALITFFQLMKSSFFSVLHVVVSLLLGALHVAYCFFYLDWFIV